MEKSKSKRSKPITKMALYLRAMRVSLWMIIPFFVLISLMALAGDANVQPGLQNMVIFIGGTTLGFIAVLLVILTPLVLQDLRHIKRQEKHYGISFNDEMKELDVRQFFHKDENWLIIVNRFRIYAFRKDFLTDFGIQRRSLLGKRMEAKVIAACADGKARMISGSGTTLTLIQEWAQET